MRSIDADVVVVGAGFFGLRIALYAREQLGAERVIVLEREADVMSRASYSNQARVHMGYHYPRSLLTGSRSRITAAAFEEEFSPAIVRSFRHFYAVASRLSKVNARSFETFCERIGAPLRPAPADVRALLAPPLIDDVWEVTEWAFDSTVVRDMLLARADKLGVEVVPNADIARLEQSSGRPAARTEDGRRWRAPILFSAVYSGVNALHAASGLDIIPVQHEIAEMLLVRTPPRLRDIAFTVMDGPFFSLMPFPARGLHTLSHVRYTPHQRWREAAPSSVETPPSREALSSRRSAQVPIILDVKRYLPSIADAEVVGSLREVKTVLLSSDHTDSRPIVVREDESLPGYVCVLGGKLDNIDDVLHRLAQLDLQGRFR
ncbi:FAD-dependent oxidoreductase [Microbacterium sp. ASV49]|uniref:FAD-dependent oxidoreductase n=1 Tax=Microbacterium candidum TaxID=3041922 RepID=A0ABT7N0S4_9MICO|nr:FAD-dependent oxidoreductase [Microbacterium sp. ASV49]MDL9980307.1 FAD-dependent oxidoreductase [Microbacterium sp. ASV49]